MTNYEVNQLYENLLSSREHNMPFPAKISFIIVQNMRKLQPIAEDYTMAKLAIGKKYGEYESLIDGYRVHPEYIEQADKELIELNNVDNPIELSKIKFSDIENLHLSLQDMEALYPMLEE